MCRESVIRQALHSLGLVRTAPDGVCNVILKFMKRATVTIPEELEVALESYRRDLEFPPSFASVMQVALKEYLNRRGYSSDGDRLSGELPAIYEAAPAPKGEKTAAEMVLEDRR